MAEPTKVAPPLPTSRPARARRWPRLEISESSIKFLVALLGLVLAFAAALFSTISRESGNLWATLILASAALLLATVVGLTTVPYLARRVVLTRVRDWLHYDVTRAGVVYVVITVVIAIPALNTGNNLLYIIVAAMLGAILVSGIVSALILRHLELDVRLPEHVFAGRLVLGRIVVRNLGRWLPSFSICVVPTKVSPRRRWQWESYTFAVPASRPPDQQWVRLPDRRLRRLPAHAPWPRILQGLVYFPFIAAKCELSADVEMRFDRRGRYHEDSFGLATRFPFAFLTKTRTMPLKRELVVYPPVEPTDEFFEVLPMITGEFETFVRGRGYDLYRIREYMPEDSARHVDWKATAKSGSLKVREFSREDERKLRIVFDNPPPGAVSPDAYERAVALTASLSWHFAAADTEISFLAPGFEGTDLYPFLAHLATTAPAAGHSLIDRLSVSEDYNVILTSRTHGTIPTALWTCSYFVFIHDGTTGGGGGRVQQKPLGSHPIEGRT
jgi:uncharacterized protein (DUF58 family)